ncbi:MAG: hypothetical protein GXY58_06720 [Planctomycetaceae bacterium]|nr:hypothetical protein [Planctomycetaceae bacterium]
MNVYVIPEDFRKDQYILKPIVKAMLAAIGKPRANVRVCQDPLLGGVTEALKWERIKEILDLYRGMVQVFLLIVDRDGQDGRQIALNTLEKKAVAALPEDRIFFAENAWQEVEVWLLAGHDLPKAWSWQDIRQDPNPKEAYFLPFAENRGVTDEPGQGRKSLAREAAGNYAKIRSRCTEDVVALEKRLSKRI